MKVLLSLFTLSSLVFSNAQAEQAPSPVAAVESIFVSDETSARAWFAAADDPTHGVLPTLPLRAELNGVDEADVMGFLKVATPPHPMVSVPFLLKVVEGNHGALLQVPPATVAAFGKARIDSAFVERVRTTAASLRQQKKPVFEVPLSIDDLKVISKMCANSRGRPVYLHTSE